ncbi:MAG TPA: hypothetical protein VFH39_01445 [Candidatus Saccharimonadales bacterium]|nr:hypothetical protein [Candidatus Saccharimonadales bacterium]
MKPIVDRLRPASGVSYVLHLVLLVLLPLVAYVLVQLGDTFVKLAYAVVLLSKWRMFAVRPRFWPAIIRANSVDIMVGLSIVLFMTHAGSQWLQLLWAALYAVWLIVIKPATGSIMTSLQAMIGQLLGLSAVYLTWSAAPMWVLVLATGLVCYLSARHFFDSFDEVYSRLLAYLWGYFGAALAWLLSHWLLFYAHGLVAQPTLILTVLGYGLAALYHLDHEERLSLTLRRQFVFVMVAVILIILTFSDWGDKVI